MTDDAAKIARRIVLETLVEIARDETRPLAVRQAAAAEAAERFRPLIGQIVDAFRPAFETLREVGQRVVAAFRPLHAHLEAEELAP